MSNAAGVPTLIPHSRSELLASGFTDSEIRADVAASRRRRIITGYYLNPDPDLRAMPDLQRAECEHVARTRAAAARAPGTVVSHISATALHGIAIYRADLRAVHLTRPGLHGNRKFADRQVHTGALCESDVTTVGGVAVTTVPRTLIDLARTTSLTTAVVAIDDALHRGLLTVEELAECLRRSRFARGHAAAVRAVRLADGRSESPGESVTRIVLIRAGLPTPELQPKIFDDDGLFAGRPDLAYLEDGVLIEFDGQSKYRSGLIQADDVTAVVLREKAREERLSTLGWLVIRLTWRDLEAPGELTRRIRGAMAARQRLVRMERHQGQCAPGGADHPVV